MTVPSTRRAPEGLRLAYRRTARRLLGFPVTIESDAYPLPLIQEAVDQLDGFRKACEDVRYLVVVVDTAAERRLRAYSPTIRIVWRQPLEVHDVARIERFTAELSALGYRPIRSESAVQVVVHATREPDGSAG